MRTLLVLRHAKSSWDDARLADFDRPLNKRGLRAAPFMGGLMAAQGLVPGLILSSPAKRASDTAELVREAGGFKAPIRYEDQIYEASPHTLRKVAAAISDSPDTLLMVGHNPGMEGFVRMLCGKPVRMPTATLAVVELDINDWPEIDLGKGILRDLIKPKEVMKDSDD
jgi:phosphohistidine phosphatase